MVRIFLVTNTVDLYLTFLGNFWIAYEEIMSTQTSLMIVSQQLKHVKYNDVSVNAIKNILLILL